MATDRLEKAGKLSKNTWNKLAKEDPEYYILTQEDKRGQKWQIEEFLKTGQKQWQRFKKLLSNYGLKDQAIQKRALDLGCGVGRIAYAMANDFNEVIGVDVSNTMINKAKKYQKILKIKNVKFITNNGFDLSVLNDESLDFVFSYIALQHCPSPDQVLAYIKEFSRVLKPGGVCLFQTLVSPRLIRNIRFSSFQKLAKIKNIFNYHHAQESAFMGNWVSYPKIIKVVSESFSSFYLMQTPIEIYKERFWDLKSEYDRWKRSFFICIK